MTLSSVVALLLAMLSLAIIPDASAIAVITRSITSGFSRAFIIVIGILLGDLIFILLAIYSLSAIVQVLGGLFAIVKYISGGYLIWLGVKLCRAKSQVLDIEEIKEESWFTDFLCGLLITLGDPKAIFFYISFLPAFVDLSSISFIDIGTIMLIATIAVCGVKLSYAYMADKARNLLKNSKAKKIMNLSGGIAMIIIGIVLMIKT